MDFWLDMARPAPQSAMVGDVELRAGSRVRLHPHKRADVLDMVLDGREAIVEGIDEDAEGITHIAVTLPDDPGRALGESRYLGHRFFFRIDEIEPIVDANSPGPPASRILVAGIGNIFFGDDGFGVAVAQRLAERTMPPGVRVVDFGIRGLDLAYALQDVDVAILVDATPRGEVPGTVFVIEPTIEADGNVAIDTHGMDPVRVLRLAQAIGRVPARTLVVGCEPETGKDALEEAEMVMELSEPVRAAVDRAVEVVESLLEDLTKR
jgi:hydrogenase maturation protease